MDEVESLIASRRIAKWPEEWRQMLRELPASEAEVFLELAALLGARPTDEDGETA